MTLWWVWLPILFYYLFIKLWMFYIRRKFFNSINWVLLEIRPPKEVGGSPKPFEYIFAGLYSLIGTVDNLPDMSLKGLVQTHFSAEIIGVGGKIRFYIRVPANFKNLVESLFYAQYPDIEIRETEDYALDVPAVIPSGDWDLWGTKFILDKPDAYPIRTYIDFLEISGDKDQMKRFIDPLSNLMEIMSRLKDGEQIWIQILCRPAAKGWQDEGKKVVDKMMGRVEKKKKSWLEEELGAWSAVIQTMIGSSGGIKPEERAPSAANLTPGEREVMEAIEKNISKTGFDSKIHFAYISKKDVTNRVNIGAIFGMLGQFGTLNLNSFKSDKGVITVGRGLFAESKKRERKRLLLDMCRYRTFWEKGYVLNIEELATLFHFPSTSVVAPMTPRLETKKGVPPMDLPISN